MALIEKPEVFGNVLAKAEQVIDFTSKLPEQVFKDRYRTFWLVDPDEVFTEEFYNRMNDFVGKLGESSWYFLVREPSPDDFFSSFGKYPCFELSINDAYASYRYDLVEEPKQNTDFAIFYAGTSRILLFSRSLEWGILVDRNFELGIAAFSNSDIATIFRASFGDENVFDLRQATDMFLIPAFGESINDVPLNIRSELFSNYS